MFKIFRSKANTKIHAIEPYLDDLYRLAYRFARNQHDAEDIVHDLVLKICAQKIDITKLDNPKPWLSKVLYRIYVDRYRHLVRSPVQNAEDLVVSHEYDSALDSFTSNDQGPQEKLEYLRFMQALDRAIDLLNEDQRILVLLFEVEGYSLNEIQEMLDLPEGTIKSRLHRARQQLRVTLDELGTEWLGHSCNKVRS